MKSDKEHKKALITGGAGNIGSATSRYFSERDIEVLVADINDKKGKKLVDEIISDGGNAQYYRMDVCFSGDVMRAFHDIKEDHGYLDYLINIAGGAKDEANRLFEDIDEPTMRFEMERNYFGSCRTIKSSIPLMAGREDPCIVNTSSGNALSAVGNPHYSASKGALLSLGRYLASSLGEREIRVNTVIPGTIPGHRTGEMYNNNVFERLKERISVKDFGKPEDVAEGIYFLTQNSYANGTELVIDGGANAGKHIV